MDLLNLSESIFCEFVHTSSMDSRCAYHPARPHFSLPVRESRLIFPLARSTTVRRGAFSGDLAVRSHDCAWITCYPDVIFCTGSRSSGKRHGPPRTILVSTISHAIHHNLSTFCTQKSPPRNLVNTNTNRNNP